MKRLDRLERMLAKYPEHYEFSDDDLRTLTERAGYCPSPDEWSDLGFNVEEIPDDVINYD